MAVYRHPLDPSVVYEVYDAESPGGEFEMYRIDPDTGERTSGPLQIDLRMLEKFYDREDV